MSVKDFYNAVTPGSSLTHGVGRGVYTIIDKDEICSAKTFENEKVPTEKKGRPSLLNEVIWIEITFFMILNEKNVIRFNF